MEKHIDWFDNVDPKRYIISDLGYVYDIKMRKVLKNSGGEILYLNTIDFKTKAINIGKTIIREFGPEYPVDIFSDYIEPHHRDGDQTNWNIQNLIPTLTKSNITIDETYLIYKHFCDGVYDNIEIGRNIGKFVPKQIISRLKRSNNAKNIAKLFGFSIDEIKPKKSKNKDITINKLKLGVFHDTDDEVWREVPEHLLKNSNYRIYVSSKGRFADNDKNVRRPRTSNTNKVPSITFNGHSYICSRLVLSTFGIDLPHILDYPYEVFSVRFKDGDKSNLKPDNLYWAPRYCRKTKNNENPENLLKVLNKICDDIRECNSIPDVRDMRKKVDFKIGNYQRMINLTNGNMYPYFTRAFGTLTWKECSGALKGYYVSTNGIIRHNEMKMLIPHTQSDDGRNYVKINNKEYLVCKLVLKAFKPLANYTGWHPKHIDGNLLNDDINNLEWVYNSPEIRITKQRWKNNIHEELKPIDWLEKIDPSRYMISNCGTVFDNQKNRWCSSHLNHKTKKVSLGGINGYRYELNVPKSVIRVFMSEEYKKIESMDPQYVCIDYLDGDPSNCVYLNLVISCRLLSDEVVERICHLLVQNRGCLKEIIDIIKKEYCINIDRDTIQRIAKKLSYTNISDKYFKTIDDVYVNKRNQRIKKIALDGNVINEYNSVTDCLLDNPGMTYHSIRDHTKGERKGKPYKGFIWEYV